MSMITSMFKKPKPQVIPAPKVIPMADQATIDEAQRRSLASQQSRGGRSSTMLGGNSLGGG